jgi:hypothetical protein
MMTARALYFPILRAKTGEMGALAHLSDRARQRTIPVLDIPEPKEEGRVSARDLMARVCEELVRTWGTAHPLYLDISRYTETEAGGPLSELVEHLFKCARQSRLRAMPVGGPIGFRSVDYLTAIANIAHQDGEGLAIRLPAEDFIDASRLEQSLECCLAALGVPSSRMDLILDFEAIARLPADQRAELAIVNVVSSAIQFAGPLGLRRIVLCGSSLPEWPTIRKWPARLAVARLELSAWRKLTENRPDDSLGFGDYGVVSPFQTKPTKNVKVPARVRFATPGQQVFYRAPRDAYRTLARSAVADAEFPSIPPSWGANAIRECAANYGDPGGPTQWVARDTNMHIEATAIHVEDHLGRVAPSLLGPPVEVRRMPWLQDSLSIIGEGT